MPDPHATLVAILAQCMRDARLSDDDDTVLTYEESPIGPDFPSTVKTRPVEKVARLLLAEIVKRLPQPEVDEDDSRSASFRTRRDGTVEVGHPVDGREPSLMLLRGQGPDVDDPVSLALALIAAHLRMGERDD